MTKKFYLNTTNILSLPIEDLKTLDPKLKTFITEAYNPFFAELEELFYQNPELNIQDNRVQELANKIEQFLQAVKPEILKNIKDLNIDIGSKNSDSLSHLAFTLQALKYQKNLKDIIHGYSFEDKKRTGLKDRFITQFFKDFERSKAQVIDAKGKLIDTDIFGSITNYYKLNQQIYKLDKLNLTDQEKQDIINELKQITKETNHFSSFFPQISKENFQHINYIISSLEQKIPLENILKDKRVIFNNLLQEPKEKEKFYLDSLKEKLNLSDTQLNVIISRFNQRNITGSEVAFGSDLGDHKEAKNIFHVQAKEGKVSFLEKIEHTATGKKTAQDKDGNFLNNEYGIPITNNHEKISYIVEIGDLKNTKNHSLLALPTQKTREYISCEALNKNDIYQAPQEIEGLLFDQEKRGYVQKIVQTLANKPEAFKSILDLTQNPLAIGSTIGNLEGIRYELFKLITNSSKNKPILALLLENGILEELTSLKATQVNNILIEIFKHNFIKTELNKAGIKDSHVNTIIDNLNLVINLTSTLKDHPIIPQLGNTLSKIITTNAKITESKGLSEKQALSQLQEQNIEKLKNIAFNLLALTETRQAATTLIRSSLNTLADIVDNNKLSENKKNTMISLQDFDKKIASEKNLKIKDKLIKERENLAKKNEITLTDELTFSTIESLGLNEKVNLTSILSSSDNIIKTIINQPEELSIIDRSVGKIQKSLSSGKNLEETAKEHSIDIANIVDTGIKILSKEEIIKGITNEKLNENLKLLDSKPESLTNLLESTKKLMPLIAQDSVFDAINKNKNNLKKILELTLPNELTEEQKKNKTPEDITKKQESLKKNKALAYEGLELFCENSTYITNVLQSIINNPETKTTLASFQNYSKAPEEKKTEEFKIFVNKSLPLLNSPETEQALFTGLDKVIDSAYQKPNLREELNFLKDDLKLVKDTLLKEIMPNLLNYVKQAGNNNQIIDLLAEAKDIIKETSDSNNKPEADRTKLKSITKEAIQLYVKSQNPSDITKGIETNKQETSDSNEKPEADLTKLKSITKEAIQLYDNPQNPSDITKGIETNKVAFSNLIDKSLSLLNKNTLKLKLLKPLGINGDFIQKMLVKINTKEGLEAIDKCIEKQSISNILGLLSATKTRSFFLSHITKSLVNYIFSPKNKQNSWVDSTAREKSELEVNKQTRLGINH